MIKNLYISMFLYEFSTLVSVLLFEDNEYGKNKNNTQQRDTFHRMYLFCW